MQADAQPHLAPAGPVRVAHPPLDRKRGLQSPVRSLEHREYVVAAGGHLVAAPVVEGRADEAADAPKQVGVGVVERREQPGGALDVGQQEGHVPGRQIPPLPAQLGADEADRHDALSRRLRAMSRAVSSSKATWPKRASALRTCEASWIGSRRLPAESM